MPACAKRCVRSHKLHRAPLHLRLKSVLRPQPAVPYGRFRTTGHRASRTYGTSPSMDRVHPSHRHPHPQSRAHCPLPSLVQTRYVPPPATIPLGHYLHISRSLSYRACRSQRQAICEHSRNLQTQLAKKTSASSHQNKKWLDFTEDEGYNELTKSVERRHSPLGLEATGWINNVSSCKHTSIFVTLAKPRNGWRTSSTQNCHPLWNWKRRYGTV